VQPPFLVADRGLAQLYAIAEAEEYLGVLQARLTARDFKVETGVPYGLPEGTWIVDEVALRHADLIVMGTHDRAGVERWVRGSVAEAVISRAAVPVMLVRAAAHGMLPVEHFDWRQPVLVVALDGSRLAEAALPVAMDLAQSLNGRLVLVGVVQAPAATSIDTYGVDDQARLAADADEYLAAIVGRVTATGLPVEHTVRRGEPATEIGRTAHEHNAAAVIMATHGRTGLARLLLGSVAGMVLRCSTSPVVLVRPAELRPAEQPIGAPATADA
jgi:nucleotide-binding universal stress UspA family protein